MEQPAGQRKPALSAIVVTPDSYATIRNLVGALRAQTARAAMELVIVVPAAVHMNAGIADLEGFCCWRILEAGGLRTVPEAKAAGIRYASAPVVVLTEDHSLPDPAWAQALIDAHAQGWAAVGPAVENGNPQSLISWADFVIGYGPWFKPVAGREMDYLPGHNSSYKRELLLEYKDRLAEVLAAETTFHHELRARGLRLYLEPAAKTFHSNFSKLSGWTRYLNYSARVFAAQRASTWPMMRRAAYSAGAFLIPVVRLKRLLPVIRRSPPELMPRVLAPMLYGLLVDAVGQWLGYSFGAGQVAEKLAYLEFHRNGVSADVVQPTGRDDR